MRPVVRGGTFTGAVVGVIALAENNLIAPTFRENVPPDTDAVLIDGRLDPEARSGAARSGRKAGGNPTAVARLLGVSYPTIADKTADYGLA